MLVHPCSYGAIGTPAKPNQTFLEPVPKVMQWRNNVNCREDCSQSKISYPSMCGRYDAQPSCVLL